MDAIPIAPAIPATPSRALTGGDPPAVASGDPYAVLSYEALSALYPAPTERVLRKVSPVVDGTARAFIERSPFHVLSTSGGRGLHGTPRGDAPGFVRVADERTLMIPDRRGNNRLDALRDVLDDPRVALLFLVPGAGEALRVGGTARITADPALLRSFAVNGVPPATVLVVSVAEVYLQCPRAVMRSALWGGRERPAGTPSIGQMLEAHTGGLVDAASYDVEAPARLSVLY